MILKIYNDDNVFQGVYFDTLKDYHIDQEYNRADSCCFSVPLTISNLNLFKLEYYVEDENSIYCIKEIEKDDNEFITIYAVGDVEEFETIVDSFQAFQTTAGRAIANLVGSNTSWTASNHSINTTMIDSIIWQNQTVFDIIKVIRDAYAVWFKFDTKNQILHIYDEVNNAVSKSYFSNELYLESAQVSSDTYQLATCIFPRGGEDLDLTISAVNNFNNRLTDFTFTDKFIFRYYDRTDITSADILLRAGRSYLKQVARPQERYKVKLLSLSGVKIGDDITIVDNIKRIKTKLKVVKITSYPQEPERGTIEVGNRWVDFAKQFVQVSQQVYPSGQNLY